MNKDYLPAIVCGFGAAVLTTIPGFKNFACCLLVPAASIAAIVLYKKTNRLDEKIAVNKAIILGLLTGVVAALFSTFFDLLITYITHTNEFIAGLPQTELIINDLNMGSIVDESLKLIKQMGKDIETNGFSALYTIMIFISNIITYMIFGILGGAIGAAILNRRNRD
jgi:uncharacterized membrane protein YeaQ/YmgE (transglycosylase-associated protein family)